MAYDIRQLAPDTFPKLLCEIPDAPETLYIKGELPSEDQKLLCVVGSRSYTSYGKEVCEKLISGLAGYPVVIVSGLALGIDAIAHKAALNAGIKTLAVPGSGLDDRVLYPRANAGLAKRILDSGGALLSEFEPNYRAAPHSFSQRNRIMAGLSHAVLVIEAKLKSGTLITSRLAGDYNRDVLTVPHSIFSKTSEGPHMLIRLGAVPVTTSSQILEALDMSAEEKEEVNLADLTEDEQRVMKILLEPIERDDLIVKLDMPVHKANVLLSAMELKGFIKELGGKLRQA